MKLNNFNIDLQHPIRDVTVCLKNKTLTVKDPIMIGDDWQASQSEFAIQMEGIGNFYASKGNYVEFQPAEGADPEWVKICLVGRIAVALLHQRKIVSFHASSFIYKKIGVMILGATGAGKSSLTASFVLNGAEFLSDDMTPVIVKNSEPYIWPVSRDIKMHEDAASQLNISNERLSAAEKGTGKHYFHVSRASVEKHLLNTILKIEIGKKDSIEFFEPGSAEKFSLLRSEICSWEILAGMPETEAEYLHQLIEIVHQVHIVRILRPPSIEIQKLHAAIADYLKNNN